MSQIDCCFYGFCAADAAPRTSQAGKPWVRLRVGVGKDDQVQWLNVAVFGKAAEVAADFKKSNKIYVEGQIKLDTWRAQDGSEKHGLSVAAFRIEKTHNIGRNRPQREDDAPTPTTPAPVSQRAQPQRPPRSNDFYDEPTPF
jgi:single-strand DNA-binding protein